MRNFFFAIVIFVLFGQTAEVWALPQRIVSTSLASDEFLIDALTKAGQISRLLAVSPLADDKNYSNVWQSAKQIKHRAGRNVESILALRPDLVILASYNHPDTIKRYKLAKIKTLNLSAFHTIADLIKNMRVISEAVGLEGHDKEFINRLAKLTFPPPRGPRPNLIYFQESLRLPGKDTLFDASVNIAGGRNPIASTELSGWPKINLEYISKVTINYIVTTENPEILHAKLSKLPIWKNTEAVKKYRYISIPGAELGSTSHYLANAIKKINLGIKQWPN